MQEQGDDLSAEINVRSARFSVPQHADQCPDLTQSVQSKKKQQLKNSAVTANSAREKKDLQEQGDDLSSEIKRS